MAQVIRFAVTLNPPSTVPATVTYMTVNGTAISGTDYTFEQHDLVFTPGGALTQFIDVPIQADPNADADKAFTVTLMNAAGATIARGTAAGVISVNTGVQPVVSMSLVAPTIVTKTPSASLNPLVAVGNQFVDAVTSQPVRLKTINWYGYDGTDLIVHGLYAGRAYKDMLDQISALGFNCIRLPFCDDMLTSTVTFVGTSGNQYVDPTQNPDIIGLTPLQALDVIVFYAASLGLRIVLDHHRLSQTSIGSWDSGFGTDGWPALNPTGSQNYLYGGSSVLRPYTPTGQWRTMWTTLASHFTQDNTVQNPAGVVAAGVGKYLSSPNLRNCIVGFDPHNEPYRPSWATWAGMCEGLFPAVNAIAPDWMMFVEGVGASADGTDTYWQGGYLRSAFSGSVDGPARPVNLGSKQNKLAYSAHEYGHSVFAQRWLQARASAPVSSMPAKGSATCQITGTTLTVWGALNGITTENPIAVGDYVIGAGVEQAPLTTQITGFLTGTGTTGTYTINTSQSVITETMSFVTNPYPVIAANTVANYPTNLYAVWDTYWGCAFKDPVAPAPVWIGEMGGGFGCDYSSGLPDPFQTNADYEVQWGNTLVKYADGLNADGSSYLTGNQQGPSLGFFALNPESGNPLGGLLLNVDYLTVNNIKMGILLPTVPQ